MYKRKKKKKAKINVKVLLQCEFGLMLKIWIYVMISVCEVVSSVAISLDITFSKIYYFKLCMKVGMSFMHAG